MDGPKNYHLSEVRDKYHVIPLTCGIWKNDANELTYKADSENKLMAVKVCAEG